MFEKLSVSCLEKLLLSPLASCLPAAAAVTDHPECTAAPEALSAVHCFSRGTATNDFIFSKQVFPCAPCLPLFWYDLYIVTLIHPLYISYIINPPDTMYSEETLIFFSFVLFILERLSFLVDKHLSLSSAELTQNWNATCVLYIAWIIRSSYSR